jgi:hypothetical protein
MTPYPLAWPENIPRWKSSRQPGAFKTTLHGAMTNVSDSLRRFGADSGKPVADLVISSNVTLGANNPPDPGVAIWFKWDGLSVCIPVDRYSKVEANLQAIHHIIEARRTELRHGTLALVRATFTGFTALPAPPGKKTWRQVLKVPSTWVAGKSEVEARYRELANERHPDKPGGSNEAMSELNAARTAALKELA